MLTFIIMQFSVAAIAPIFHFILGMERFDAAVYAYISSFVIGLIIIVYLMRNDIKEESVAHPISIGTIVGWSILGVFLAWISQAIAVTIEIEVFGIDPNSENTEVIVDFTRGNLLFMLIPAIIAPIVEELIFRKILF